VDSGFVPRFGLYNVDYTSYTRTATLGATVLGDIAGARKLTTLQRTTYGGLGPMTPEAGVDATGNSARSSSSSEAGARASSRPLRRTREGRRQSEVSLRMAPRRQRRGRAGVRAVVLPCAR